MLLPSALALHAYHPKEKKAGWLFCFLQKYKHRIPPRTHTHTKKPCLTFLFRCKIFHSPTRVAVEGSCNQRDFLLSATTPLSHQKRGLHPESCCPFHLAVKVFFWCVRFTIRAFNKRTAGTALCHCSLLFHMKWQSPSRSSRAIADSASGSPRRSLRWGWAAQSAVRQTAEWQKGRTRQNAKGKKI